MITKNKNFGPQLSRATIKIYGIRQECDKLGCWQHDKVETETKNFQVSDTVIKDKSVLGTHGQKLCDNIDASWMIPTCDADPKEGKCSHSIYLMASGINFYSYIVISLILISDIANSN